VPASNRTFQAPVYATIGNDLLFSYYAHTDETGWSERFAANPTDALERQKYALLRFRHVMHFSSEIYEDDTVSKHRLSQLGLKPFSHYEVEKSELIKIIRRRLADSEIHQYDCPSLLHHFVFTMHGTIFEIVSSGIEIETGQGSTWSALEQFFRHPTKEAHDASISRSIA